MMVLLHFVLSSTGILTILIALGAALLKRISVKTLAAWAVLGASLMALNSLLAGHPVLAAWFTTIAVAFGATWWFLARRQTSRKEA